MKLLRNPHTAITQWIKSMIMIFIDFYNITITKIKHPLKQKGGYLWWPLCCRWRRLCLLFLEWQSHPRPTIVGGHQANLFRFRNKWQYQWTTNQWPCSLPWYYFAVSLLYLYVMIPCSSPHIIFFHLVNIKLHCRFHHCRAWFSFSGDLHVSGLVWP